MKALIMTHGTRGDVQPYAALAVALRAAGHEAVLAAPTAFAPLAATHQLPFAALDDGPNRLAADPILGKIIESGYRGLRGKLLAVQAIRAIKPLMAQVLDTMADAATSAAAGGADLLVHGPSIPAQHVAEWLEIPAVPALAYPTWVPTAAFPMPGFPLPRLPRAANRATYALGRAALRSFAGITTTWRRQRLGLPPRPAGHDFLRRPDGGPATVLQAFSQRVLPGPADWPAQVHTVGYWFLPAPPGWQPRPRLAEFLAAGAPPVYLGFGSMAGRDPARTTAIVVEAVRRAGVRAVLATGWGGLRAADLPTTVHALDDVPHDWLLPRTAAVVHHGGAGTTAAALAAGRPQVLCPFTGDQPFWAARMHALGLAPTPLPQRALSADTLAAAITRAVTNGGIAEQAERLGHFIRAEQGLTGAVRILERLYAGAGR